MATADTVRSMEQFEEMPTEEELSHLKDRLPDGTKCCRVGGHEWHRNLGPVKFVRGMNWSGSKGNWLLLGGLILAGLLASSCDPTYEEVPGVITAVGGCDRFGDCGISLQTERGPAWCKAHMPVVGSPAVCFLPRRRK